MQLPGKKDLIEIPMQEPFAAKEFVDYLSYKSDYGNSMRESFIEITTIPITSVMVTCSAQKCLFQFQ